LIVIPFDEDTSNSAGSHWNLMIIAIMKNNRPLAGIWQTVLGGLELSAPHVEQWVVGRSIIVRFVLFIGYKKRRMTKELSESIGR